MSRRLAVAALLLGLATPAAAGPLESLVMPGPVAAAHAEIESQCAKCHEPFHREAQRGLCLDCHDATAADLRARAGFHGRAPSARDGDCRSCHGEHLGREADIVGLDRDSFDHAATDHPLEGAHARVRCEACHGAGKPFREAPSGCADCHASDDPHRGRMGTDCGSCHGEGAWREARFDHASTRFPLEGGHRDVACALCHAGERYRETPTDCGACHAVSDAHAGRFGPKCGDCHTTAGWKESGFDHARDTRFALTGAHAATPCEGCHAGGLFERKLATDCLSCHRGDDVHEGRNGPGCEECHGTAAWKPARFDHDQATRFPLRGEHRALACEACHTGPIHEQRLETGCIACHRDDDVHEGQQGTACAHCHDEGGWRERVRFDHDLGRFPLLGLHAVAACEECHATATYRGTETRCVGCHAGDDSHQRRLGPSCEQCHNPNAWSAWRFDHAAQTSFPLNGAHAELACADCHRAPVDGEVALAGDCESCHAADDPHRGDFGRDCGRCHGERSWSDLAIVR